MLHWFSARLSNFVVFVLMVGIAFTCTSFSHAAESFSVPQTDEVKLAWDANDQTPTGYRIYQRLEGQSYDGAQPVWEGAATSCTVYNLAYETTYYFVVRAYSGDTESGDSNEVTYTTGAMPINTYTITSSSSANGSIAPLGGISVEEGTDQSFSITPSDGYQVADVLVDGASVGVVSTYTFQQVNADHTISVQFALSSYSISASADAGGSISPSGSIDVEHGTTQEFAVGSAVGYQVADVLVDGVSVGAVSSYLFDSVNADHTIHATFRAQTFSISASTGSNGSITPSGSSNVSYAGSQTYTMAPDSGYEIDDVKVDGVSVGDSGSYTFANVTSSHTISVTFVQENQPPTADAGPDQTVDENSTVFLNSLNSFDPDDGIATFTWRQIQGVDVSLSAADEPETSFVAPNVGTSGTALVFELTVTDFSGVTSTDSCIVNVTWVNMAPEADAGADQTVAEGFAVTIDASGSTDADDGIVSYAWKQTLGPVVTLSDASSAAPRFQTPNVGVDGASMGFEVTVTDVGGLQDTDTCLVNVTWVNTPPMANAGMDQQVGVGDEVVLDGSQSFDADTNDSLSYRWHQSGGIPVVLSDAYAQSPVFLAPDAGEEGAELVFELTVTDNQGLMGTDTCQVSVAPAQPAPDTIAPTVTIQNLAGDQLTTSLRKFVLSGTASDDVEVAQVVWENSTGDSGVAIGTTDWVIDYIRVKRGENIITVTAYDTAGNAGSVTKTVYLVRTR